MHLLLQLKQLLNAGFCMMYLFLKKTHHFAENREVISLRYKSKLVLLEEWDNDLLKIIPPIHLKSVALLMVWPCVFLKVHASTSEEVFKGKEYIFVFFYKFYVKLRLDDNAPNRSFSPRRIANIHRKTPFSIYQSDNVIGR